MKKFSLSLLMAAAVVQAPIMAAGCGCAHGVKAHEKTTVETKVVETEEEETTKEVKKTTAKPAAKKVEVVAAPAKTHSGVQDFGGSVAEFKKILTENDKVFVDFYAPWCGPCKRALPVITTLAGESKYNTIKFVKINTQDAKAIAKEYGVSSIPRFMIFKGGNKVNDLTGYEGESKLRSTVDALKTM